MIKTAVMCRNSNGAPEMVHFDIECTDHQYTDGDHYGFAEDKARNLGFEPKLAFDENDPA